MATGRLHLEDLDPFLAFGHEVLGVASLNALRGLIGRDTALAFAQVDNQCPLPQATRRRRGIGPGLRRSRRAPELRNREANGDSSGK